ncbi:SCAN domain-containing protein 3 [Trichonephila clavipes]|nr:SCAN domain-containing protein 3 [Trichonephila clavipes]
MNPADVLSRGCSPRHLLESKWFGGTEWLLGDAVTWPTNELQCETKVLDFSGEEKPLCVICSKILAADSMKPNKLKRHFETLHARCKKPHTIAEELILPTAIEIVETMFGDNFAKELQSIPLSNDTASRRIDDIAEDEEQQLFGKLRDKLFSIQLDEATDSNKDAHFIAYNAGPVKSESVSLPADRVRDAGVFEVIGIDLAGPLFLKNGEKVWVVFYTCAEHLELVTAL